MEAEEISEGSLEGQLIGDEQRPELVTLKPGLWGINVALKELFHRCIAFLKGKR